MCMLSNVYYHAKFKDLYYWCKYRSHVTYKHDRHIDSIDDVVTKVR